jgi:hypothetical protein
VYFSLIIYMGAIPMNQSLFSVRYKRAPDTSGLGDLIEGWLQHWGAIYARDVSWRAYDPSREEQFIFRLEFTIMPATGRRPTDYLLLEILAPQQSVVVARRTDARRHLLTALWPGRMLALESHLLRADPEAAQIRILNAL